MTARRQESGRGRTGAGWIHAPRAVAASLALEVPWPADRIGPLPLVAGMAMRSALGSVGANALLKWPNDLMNEAGAKVGGVLSESSGGVVVIGVGVNLWFPDPPEGIAGVFPDDPGQALVGVLARSWADRLLDAVAAGPSWDIAGYRKASSLIGRPITWSGGSGTAVDIAADGALVVSVGSERLELRSGAVTLVRRATLAPDHDAAGEGQ